MRQLSHWFLHNSVAANLLMLAIIVAGMLSLSHLRVESFPQIAPSSLVISVAYPGGTAEQIDQSVTQRIEQAIGDLTGIKQIVSESSAGFSQVRVRKTSGTDLNRLIEDVRNRVNAIANFPVQAESPQISRDEYTNLAAFVIISAPRPDQQLQPIARQVELALKKHPKIAKVSNWGARMPLIVIEPKLEQLKNYRLSLEELSARIEQMSIETRSGELKSARGRMVLRGDGYADNLQELKQLGILSSPTGSVTLGDLAHVYRDYEASGSIVRNNGESAIALLISTSQQDNLLEVSQAVKQVLAQQAERLPNDVSLSTMADMAPYIEDQLSRLADNAWQGLLIVLILLGIFLELKVAIWVAMGIPVAIAGTFAAMGFMNYSINDITLFGIILVLGILVDDAVVVGESIHEQRSKSKQALKATWRGLESVSVATVFGALTTIAAFSPMLWIDNELAKLLASFSAVVIFALIFSLIESKLILPAHLAAIRYPSITDKPSVSWFRRIQQLAQAGLNRFSQRIYSPILSKAIDNKTATLISFFALVLLAYGFWSTGLIRSAIFPEIPGRYISANVSLEDGAPLPLQQKTLFKLEQSALQLNQQVQEQYQLQQQPISNLLIWSDGYGSIEATLEISNEALSNLPNNLLLNQWRELNGSIEGAYSSEFTADDEPAGGTSLAISAEDRQLAVLAATALSEQVSRLAGAQDVRYDARGGSQQLRIELNDFGRQLGLTQRQLALFAGGAFGEREIHRLLQQGQETKVIVRYNHSQKTTTQQLLATPIFLENGESLMLGDVAKLRFEQHAEVLYRRNQEQVVNLYWRQDRGVQSPEEVLAKLQPIIKDIEQRYPGVSINPDGEFEELGEVQAGFKSAMIMTLLLIYILLAVPLKSYWQPLIIMAVIPFGFAGAIFGHGIMDLPLSILSMFGMMAMTGIVINDSLVLITRFNQYYRAGMPLKQALIKAGTSRLRAIFLTTITTVCGLLPLLLESAEQAQYLKPAAVSLVFGELFATGVTLVTIPTLLGVFTRRDVVKLPAKVAVFNS
ncbi:AcrB/AcrD/AcrF family protein [Agarivorans sp. B2Z047]|uniref:efflux RND transporter permease subunit n=1 Tax=Agarivorans sp. B2Z047 TaxID=2652721 RepID=UPI00128BC61E|nr:efflux RND transporter permease subunit [Agarivorans sp. B2Z047]MPW29267.1 AcrB/AcrD/AcrF family protein [Agarivorans sp. B2Z047]UQN41820.1 efflux RND transporter permease subunit [Agarivorans sp. B2Z047]